MATEYGPTYWDVSEYVNLFSARWGCLVSFRLLPPHRVGTNGKYTSWAVEVQVRSTTKDAWAAGDRVEYWGSRSAHKTLPGALHAALRALEERYEEREQSALAQARF